MCNSSFAESFESFILNEFKKPRNNGDENSDKKNVFRY
jgi:hypothetical protein